MRGMCVRGEGVKRRNGGGADHGVGEVEGGMAGLQAIGGPRHDTKRTPLRRNQE